MALNVGAYLALEELEIEKVTRLEKSDASEDELDILKDNLLKEQEYQTEPEVDESDMDNDSEDSDMTDEPDDTDTDESSDTEADDDTEPTEPEEDDVSTESYMMLHKPAIEAFKAIEMHYVISNANSLSISTEGVKEFAHRHLIRKDDGSDGLITHLGKLGFHYGKLGLKHVAKSILNALIRTAKALQRSSKRLIRERNLKIKAYQNFQTKLTKARETLAILSESNIEPDTSRKFTDTQTIATLKIGDSLNFQHNIAILIKLNTEYLSATSDQTKLAIASIIKNINGVMSGKYSEPHVDPNMSSKLLPKLKHIGKVDGLLQYRYPSTLPGDMVMQVYIPDSRITDYDMVKQAYRESHAVMRVDDRLTNTSKASIDYMDISQINNLIGILGKLCETGEQLLKGFQDIFRYQGKLKPSLTSYLDYLAAEQDSLTVKESLAEYVGLKTAYIDNVVVNGAIYIHDLNLAVLSAGLNYLKASLEHAGQK